MAPIVNSVAAACHAGYIPTDVYLLSNPTVDAVVDRAASMISTVVELHDADEPTITIDSIEDERDFEAVADYLREAIEDGQQRDADIAVDVTPGRTFWSILSFEAGTEYGVEHIFYTHLKTEAYYGSPFPLVPRPALDLVDFTGEV